MIDQAIPSLYRYKPDGTLVWNEDHLGQVLEGKAGINEISGVLGIYRSYFREEFYKLRLGNAITNLKVIALQHKLDKSDAQYYVVLSTTTITSKIVIHKVNLSLVFT